MRIPFGQVFGPIVLKSKEIVFTTCDGARRQSKPTRLRDAQSEIRFCTTRWRPISNVSVTDERGDGQRDVETANQVGKNVKIRKKTERVGV